MSINNEDPTLQSFKLMKKNFEKDPNGACLVKLLSLLIHLYTNDLKDIQTTPVKGVFEFLDFLQDFFNNMENKPKRDLVVKRYAPKLAIYKGLDFLNDFINEFDKICAKGQDISDNVYEDFVSVLSTISKIKS